MSKELIDNAFSSIKAVHDYFGYTEDWVCIPLDDARDVYWTLTQDENGRGNVRYANLLSELEDEDAGEYYENIIYTQRFLPKYVWRTEDYTMISVDTQCDGNKFLQIFDNTKEVK